MRSMKAAVLRETNGPLTLEEISVPEPKDGQVLVKVEYSGLCHSQLNEIKGRKGPDKYLPHTLGHEGAGVIEKVGTGVVKVKPGDRVVLTWIKGKGINAASPLYFRGEERINSGQLSTFNEFTVTAENRVVPIPDATPLDIAALLGCAVSTGMGAVFNDAMLKPGDTIAVYGTGGIGMSAIHASSVAGASRIFAVDVDDDKLTMAKELGATDIINASRCNPVGAIMELSDRRGVDFAVESAGLKLTMEQSFESVRNGGGRAIIVGNLPAGERISIDPFALICGKEIIGSWGGGTDPDRDIPKYAKLYLDGALKLDRMITHRFTLNKINEAFDLLETGKAGRILVRL